MTGMMYDVDGQEVGDEMARREELSVVCRLSMDGGWWMGWVVVHSYQRTTALLAFLLEHSEHG